MRLIFCCLSFLIASVTAKQLDVKVNGRHAILMNADTGAILYEKGARVPAYPASTTKIGTLLFLLEEKKIQLDRKVTVSSEALRAVTDKNRHEALPHWLESDGTMIGLVRGETLSIETLLHGLMLRSGNDAANALAEAASGSVPVFIEELNQYLKKIGCSNTQYYNPHGYHHPEHFTTAYDLCLMFQKALQNPTFREIIAKESYLRPKTNKRAEEELKQANKLVVKGNKYFYPRSLGGKTGFHSFAGNNLVTAATHEGRTLIAVTLGSGKKSESYEDAHKLFEAAFAETREARLLVPALTRYAKAVPGGKTNLEAILIQDFTIHYFPSEEPEVKAFVQWDALSLPIKKGQKVGELRAFDQNGQLVASSDLFAKEAVEKTLLFVFQEKWENLLK